MKDVRYILHVLLDASPVARATAFLCRRRCLAVPLRGWLAQKPVLKLPLVPSGALTLQGGVPLNGTCDLYAAR